MGGWFTGLIESWILARGISRGLFLVGWSFFLSWFLLFLGRFAPGSVVVRVVYSDLYFDSYFLFRICLCEWKCSFIILLPSSVYFLIHNRVYADAIYKQSGKYLDSPDRM